MSGEDHCTFVHLIQDWSQSWAQNSLKSVNVQPSTGWNPGPFFQKQSQLHPAEARAPWRGDFPITALLRPGRFVCNLFNHGDIGSEAPAEPRRSEPCLPWERGRLVRRRSVPRPPRKLYPAGPRSATGGMLPSHPSVKPLPTPARKRSKAIRNKVCIAALGHRQPGLFPQNFLGDRSEIMLEAST